MPSYKDPDKNREYMKQYMRGLRRQEMLKRIGVIDGRRRAFVARERDLKWKREWRNLVEGQ